MQFSGSTMRAFVLTGPGRGRCGTCRPMRLGYGWAGPDPSAVHPGTRTPVAFSRFVAWGSGAPKRNSGAHLALFDEKTFG